MIILSLFLVLLVIATCTGVMFMFFKRLRLIEKELWGQKKREAADTAAEAKETPDETEDE